MNPPSKEASPSAAYRRIEASLRSRIRHGHWPVGTMLPSRRDLAREYGVSPITMERAVTHLIADGTLHADTGRGTFVANLAPAESNLEPTEQLALTAGIYDSAVVRRPSATRPTLVPPATVGIIASLYLFNTDHLELNNYLVRTLLDSMERALSEEGVETHFYNRVPAADQPLLSLEQSLASTVANGVNAVVMITFDTDPAVIDESLMLLDSRDIPVVCVTSSELRRPVPHVFYDNYSAGYQAAQHLLRRNHREILALAPFTASWVQERLAGVRAAAEHAKLPDESVRVYPDAKRPWIIEEDPEILGYEAGRAAFTEGLVPSAVICVNDGVAFGFVKAAAEAGKTIGRDIAVVGFDNHPRSFSLGITSLRAPMEGMGREAAHLLVRELRGEGTGFQVRLRWSLIPRASTRAVSRPSR